MEYQNKQWLRRKSLIGLVRLNVVAIIAPAVFLILVGTCGLQISFSAAHARVTGATSIVVGSRLEMRQALTPPSVDPNYTISVYFSKASATGGPWGATFPLKRAEPVLNHVGLVGARATYAIQQLIAGPTKAELQAGYSSLVKYALFGKSTCVGQQNFILTIDRKGIQAAPGTATLKLCRQVSSAGVGVDAGIRAEVRATLQQFASIKNVVILRSDGHCFGDESGADVCLR